jgi:RHS repeat-associated protein
METAANQGSRQSGPGKAASSRDAGKEVVAMRTRNSTTSATNVGYVTEIYGNSIHYRDSNGRWQQIDDTLIPANVKGYADKNKANAYSALLPATLAYPVRFALTSGVIEFALVGATGAVTTKGATATYVNALPGAAVSFSAQPDSLKEAISLSNAQAPTTFTYTLTLPAGWLARANKSGGIDLVDKTGKLQASFRAPYMADSSHVSSGLSHAVAMTIGAAAGTASAPRTVGFTAAQTITVAADKNWIDAPGRVFPVVIDPTIDTNINYYGGNDCYLQRSQPNTTECVTSGYAGSTDYVGFDGSNLDRGIESMPIEWDYTQFVPNSNILDAELDLTLAASSSSVAVPVTAYPITKNWNPTGVTWNNTGADGNIPWTNPGGDYGAALSTVNVGPSAGGTYAWGGLTQTIQNWVQTLQPGTTTDYGFLLRLSNESQNAMLQFLNQNYDLGNPVDPALPHLRVQWNGWGGLQPFFHYETKQLDDRMSINVNVANGQLVVHNQDIAVHGVGQNLTIDRYYNSLSDIQWHLGTGWNLNQGCDVQIDINDLDGVTYKAPDGYEVLFRNNGSGGYITPPGVNADLVKNQDGTFTMTLHGSNTKYNFQSGGCLQSEVDRNGNPISMRYNGSLQTITDTEGRATTFTYNSPISSDFITQMTDSANRTYQYGYDANGDLTTYTDPNNKVTSYAYNSNLQMSQITDPNGNIVNFSYGTSYPQPLTQISYVNSACSGGACNTNFAYNSGAGPCTSSGIWMNTVVTDANGHNTTYCYDNQGRVIEVRDANNNKRSGSYNSNSNVTSLADAVSSITQLTYDTNNNLTKIQAPPSSSGQSAASTSFGYQVPGQTFLASSRTDSQGNCQSFTYDTAGNLTNVYDGQSSPCDGRTGGANSCNAYQGDPSGTCGATSAVSCTNAKPGEICWAKDGKGNKTSYAYDLNHNLSLITPPTPLVATPIVSDSLSRVSSVTDGKGQKTTYSYDALDRVTQILFGGATTCTPLSNACTQFSYDADGNVATRSDVTGTTTFGYDTMNRLTSKTVPVTFACNQLTTMTFGYDPVGNLTSYCDAGGTVSYTYDLVNRVQNMAEPTGTCSGTPTLCSTFAYDSDNRLTTLTFPGGATQNLTYDGAGNEKTAVGKTSGGAVITSFSYTYAAGTQDKGAKMSMTESDPLANLVTSYSYDAFDRLITAANSQTTLHYTYDAAGNRCSTGTTCDGSWTYNAANELTSSPGVSSYSYDANGSLSGASAGGSFTYNSQNQTTASTWNGNTLSGMTYADVGQSERTAAGSFTFASSPMGLQVSRTGSANTYFPRDGKGNLIGQILPDSTHWYFLKDGVGSIVAVINGAGTTVANRYSYDPFGKVTVTGSQANPWGYAGGFQDSTKLVKFGTRYYDPNLGRWTQQDPLNGSIANPGTIDKYTYAGDNPTNMRDPKGLDLTQDWVDYGFAWAGFFVAAGALAFAVVLGPPIVIALTAVALALTTYAVWSTMSHLSCDQGGYSLWPFSC